ncbi:COG complex component [Abortiporus biennis]|nr:COG complex component [Abortiporus biennis]
MATGTSPQDPYELERLAEELAVRELKSPLKSPAGDLEEIRAAEHHLPLYVPLSHDNVYLSAKEFNVEEFLLSRSYTSLPDLRSELRDYLATLKEELVKLINDDYEAFISLSTDLQGEGARLERLKWPLDDIRNEVLESKSELQRIEDSIQAKLKKRATLREEKAYLHLLLKISESVSRLESLLLIASPNDDDEEAKEQSRIHTGDNSEDRLRSNRAKHLSRVAAEFTQLLYHVSKASTEKCAFVEEIQWRIDRIKSTLSSDLDHMFSTTIKTMTEGKGLGRDSRGSESDKAKWTSEITDCLRTYDALGLWRDAEEILRRDVVRQFIKKTIYPGALAAPHSPIIPHTPLPTSVRPAPPETSLPPRTPYTPFTAFASKQNPFESTFETNGGTGQAHILDDQDDPLATLYNTILRFVDRDMKRIMEIAEKVGVKSHSKGLKGPLGKLPITGSTPLPSPLTQKEEGFELMANVIWAELGQAIMDELGSVVFAAGKPDEFRKHHEVTQAFIRALEFLAPSVDAIGSMRTHPVYIAFEKRWQLPIYFQLRFKEIVTKLEEALVSTRLEPNAPKAVAPFVTTQAAAVWEAIETCWSAQVYIPDLSHRFWKFHLQLMSRYRSWLEASLPPIDPTAKVATTNEKIAPGTPSSLARAATPNIPTEPATAESIAADELLLFQLSTAITDVKALEISVWKLWREELSTTLPDIHSVEGDVDDSVNLEDTLRHAMSRILSLVPPLCSQIILILSRRGCDALLPMRSIPSQFRAMSSSKRLPSEPSHFVALVFRPLKTFFGIGSVDGAGAAIKDYYLTAFAEEVFEIVAQRYIYFLTAMKKTEESLRRLKKGKKSTFSLFGSSSTPREDEGRADEEKIRAQMILDVEAFGKDAEKLGVAVREHETYRSLVELAHANLADEGNHP